jgi:hypothetical protein
LKRPCNQSDPFASVFSTATNQTTDVTAGLTQDVKARPLFTEETQAKKGRLASLKKQ